MRMNVEKLVGKINSESLHLERGRRETTMTTKRKMK